jgi:hypothetical protein
MKDSIDLIAIHSFYRVYLTHGRKTVLLGTSRLDKGETEKDAKRRIQGEFAKEIQEITKEETK